MSAQACHELHASGQEAGILASLDQSLKLLRNAKQQLIGLHRVTVGASVSTPRTSEAVPSDGTMMGNGGVGELRGGMQGAQEELVPGMAGASAGMAGMAGHSRSRSAGPMAAQGGQLGAGQMQTHMMAQDHAQAARLLAAGQDGPCGSGAGVAAASMGSLSSHGSGLLGGGQHHEHMRGTTASGLMQGGGSVEQIQALAEATAAGMPGATDHSGPTAARHAAGGCGAATDGGSQAATDEQHLRFSCPVRPFVLSDDRQALAGHGNALTCAHCVCYVCGTAASACEAWLKQGHCHASDRDPYWRAHREYRRSPVLSESPLLHALNVDEHTRAESKTWCLECLVAFQRYSLGKMASNGMIFHTFQHVTDVASAAMKAIVGLLSNTMGRTGGPASALAVLDGITAGMVVNTWRHKVSSTLCDPPMCMYVPDMVRPCGGQHLSPQGLLHPSPYNILYIM